MPALTPSTSLLLSQQLPVAGPAPHPVALQLLDLPLWIPVQRVPVGEDGEVPRWAREVAFALRLPDGTRVAVRVTGDPRLGLPRHQDADVLLALFRIISERGPAVFDVASGALRSIHFRMIVEAMGRTVRGTTVADIKESLKRWYGVRFWYDAVHEASDPAQAVIAGAAAPQVPTAATTTRRRVEGGRAVLTAFDMTDLARTTTLADGTVSTQSREFINALAILPDWVHQAIAGWAAWIDVERHAALASPSAKRLYQLLAAHAARRAPGGWSFAFEDLAPHFIGDPASKAATVPSRLRERLAEAAAELAACGVLHHATWRKLRPGCYTFDLTPGPVLEFAELLRGAGLLDTSDVRVLYALLRKYGVKPAEARQMLREHAGALPDLLLYLGYAAAQRDPNKVIHAPVGFLRAALREGFSWAADSPFAKWKARALETVLRPPRALARGDATGDTAGPTGTSATRRAAVGPPAPALQAWPTPAADPALESCWEALREQVLDALGAPGVLSRLALESLVPVGAEQGTLLLWHHPQDLVTAMRVTELLGVVRGALTLTVHDGTPLTDLRLVTFHPEPRPTTSTGTASITASSADSPSGTSSTH